MLPKLDLMKHYIFRLLYGKNKFYYEQSPDILHLNMLQLEVQNVHLHHKALTILTNQKTIP